MSEVSSRQFKKKYNYCRLRVKEWEKDFIKEHGQPPSRVDIKSADAKIKECYKEYWHLKSKLLENEIFGNFVNDSSHFEDAVLSENICNDKSSNSNCLNLEKSDAFVTSDLDENNKSKSPISTYKNCHDADATSQRKKSLPFDKSKITNTNTNERCSNNTSKNPEPKKWMRNASSKIFEGVSFKVRNPRKAFSRKSDLSLSGLTSEGSFVSDVSSCPSPLIDDAATPELSFSVEHEVSPKIKSLIQSTTALSPLLGSATKVETISGSREPASHPLSLMTQSVRPSIARKLDAGWLERCSQVIEKEEAACILVDSGFDSTTLSCSSSPSLEKPADVTAPDAGMYSSDDDLICDSDDETSSQKILSFKRKADALNSSLPLRDDFSNDTDATEKHNSKKVKFIDSPSGSACTLPIAKHAPLNKSQTAPQLNRNDQMKKEILEKKIKSGSLNENYVKINMKKKVYVRGKKNFSYSKHKKSEWKKKKNELHSGGEIGGVMKCFKCGDVGHFSRSCKSAKEGKLLAIDEEESDSELPCLEEAEALARGSAVDFSARKDSLLCVPEPEETADSELPDLEGVPMPAVKTSVLPLCLSDEDVLCALRQFGHDSFREGQQAAVSRILSGKSTLLMLSTGSGKSLCYQLPAFLHHKANGGIALVVSPLVSLMDDQVNGSTFPKLGCLHSNQTEKQRANVIAQIEAGELAALLVSPEAVVSCDSFGFGSVLKKLPPISFACIDEVHCVSQWSYNFRPAYLMLTKVLRERLNVKTFLGLTATASKKTVTSIVKELGISEADGDAVIRDTPLPAHLQLAVSRVENKDAAILHLVTATAGGATIVYCTRQDECVRLATLIRTTLRGVTAEAYHAGLVASKRKSVQKNFMLGKLQVVVATVAFGMGINKQDIRCVFHYNMPKDWESYVQEVGRAGRDGKEAKCHLLLHPKGGDLLELRRHIYSNAVDRYVLRRLLARVFAPCTCTPGTCAGHEVAFSVAETVTALDIPEENISTLLCYLELHKDRLIKMLTPAYMTCSMSSYNGARGLRLAAHNCPPLAVAIAQTEGGATAASLSFDVIKLARHISWDSGTVKRHLKQREWKKNKTGSWRRSGINVSFTHLGFRVRSRGDLTPEQLDNALECLVQRVEGQQETSLSLLQSSFSTFHHFATELKSDDSYSRSDDIKDAIRTYFETDNVPQDIPQINMKEKDFDEDAVAADVRHLVINYRDNTFNGRAAARILHGIQSPNYPAAMWARARQWRAHLDKPFPRLLAIATREVLRLK